MEVKRFSITALAALPNTITAMLPKTEPKLQQSVAYITVHFSKQAEITHRPASGILFLYFFLGLGAHLSCYHEKAIEAL